MLNNSQDQTNMTKPYDVQVWNQTNYQATRLAPRQPVYPNPGEGARKIFSIFPSNTIQCLSAFSGKNKKEIRIRTRVRRQDCNK